MAIVGRPISPEELNRYGQSFNLADTPFVMASRDERRPNGFSLDELAQVYDGTLLKWDSGAPIRLVMRGSFESDTLLLKSMSPGLEKAVEMASKRPGMAGAVNDIETAKQIASTPGSLGPTTLGLLTTMGLGVTVFSLNGAAPSIANLKNGSYPWRKRLAVVIPQRPSPATASFAAFLRTPKAQELMVRNDHLPMSQ